MASSQEENQIHFADRSAHTRLNHEIKEASDRHRIEKGMIKLQLTERAGCISLITNHSTVTLLDVVNNPHKFSTPVTHQKERTRAESIKRVADLGRYPHKLAAEQHNMPVMSLSTPSSV